MGLIAVFGTKASLMFRHSSAPQWLDDPHASRLTKIDSQNSLLDLWSPSYIQHHSGELSISPSSSAQTIGDRLQVKEAIFDLN